MGHRYAAPFTCVVCGAPTKASANWRKIFIHAKPDASETCWASGLTPRGVQRRLTASIAVEHRLTGPAMPMPSWFSRWEGESYPSIVLFARRRMGYWFPNVGKADHEEVIKELLAKNVRPTWEGGEHLCWTVSDDHFLQLVGTLLKRHQRVSVGREYNALEACNWRCQNAQSPRCTCSCQARNHAHGEWMKGWRILFEDNRVMDGRSWSWMAVEKDATTSRH